MFIQRSQCKNTPGICLKKSFISNTDICNGIGCVVNERKMGEFGDYLYTICTLTSVLNVIVMFKVIVYTVVVYFFSQCHNRVYRKYTQTKVQIYFIDHQYIPSRDVLIFKKKIGFI